jgi:proteasome lid subunit RPN8/RPN11
MVHAPEITLTETAWAEISRHAADAFPEECCGVILEYGGREQVRRFKNIQNQLRALDPETYPRDATIAYAMDPKELESTIDEAARAGGKIKAFYHSHPGHEAYFSAEDKAFAMPFGEPNFPDTVQIVISIYDRAVKRLAAYAWVETKKDFVEIPLRKIAR